MDEEFDTSVDTSDVDTSADMDTSDFVDDVPDDTPDDTPEDVPEDKPEMLEEDDLSEDIPEDVSEDEPEMTEDNALSEDIPEDVSEDEPEMTEEDDLSEDIPKDVSEDEPEMTEEDDLSEDIPEDVPEDEPEMTGEDDLSDDVLEDVPEDEPEMTEDNALSDDVPENVPEEQEEIEDTSSDVESGDSDEPAEDIQAESMDDAAADETADDNASDVNGSNFGEQNNTLKETADEANEFNDGTQNKLSKVLKRDELDLLKSGNNAINQRLEAQADDYRDKAMNEDEIRDRLAVDKWNFQKEFLEDAFPGQDVSPNVFDGLSENGAKDRIADIENSVTLRNQLRSDEADNTLDRESFAHKWDEDELEPEPFKPAIKDVVGEDEYKNYQDIYDTVSNLDVSDTYKDTLVEQLKNMNPELKGLYNDYANDLKCLDTNYPGIANFDRTKGGFVFSETKDVNKGLGAGNTFFHESAHMMDYLTGESGNDLSVTNDLTSAIQEDYNDALSNIMKTHNCSLEDAQSKLSDELWAHPVEANCISDVFGGLSENKVSGPWGHTTDYWAKRPRSAVGSEAFAEITADSASNPQSLAFTKKYMPKTYSAYQSMIKGARKNG